MAKKKQAKPLQKQELAALKALVTLYGARGAARMAKLPEGTVTSVAWKHKWRKATGFRPESEMTERAIDAAELIAKEIAESREKSERNLAQYTLNASQAAAKHENPLEVARKVRDVAGVYQVLYPPEAQEGLIEGSILIGQAVVTPNLSEIAARAKEVEIGDGRLKIVSPSPISDLPSP